MLWCYCSYAGLTCVKESGWCSREWAARFWKVPTLPASFKLKDIFLDFCVACLDVNHLDIWTIVVERKKNLAIIFTLAKVLG